MHKKTAYGGIAAALAVILLAASSYIPTGRAAMLFAASVLVYTVRVICGNTAAFVMYAASAVLGLLIGFGASPAVTVMFALCFGNYPILRSFTERFPLLLQIVLKTVMYLIYFAAAFAVFKYFVPVDMKFSAPLLFGAGAVLFAFYDILLAYTGRYALSIVERRYK